MDDDSVVWVQTDLEAKYANCFRVGSNALEIIIDFAQCGTGSHIAQIHTRIIVSPAHAIVLLRLLTNLLEES